MQPICGLELAVSGLREVQGPSTLWTITFGKNMGLQLYVPAALNSEGSMSTISWFLSRGKLRAGGFFFLFTVNQI